jgi:hypothetical protein
MHKTSPQLIRDAHASVGAATPDEPPPIDTFGTSQLTSPIARRAIKFAVQKCIEVDNLSTGWWKQKQPDRESCAKKPQAMTSLDASIGG